jgi:multidrug efflux pump subunit AcrB
MNGGFFGALSRRPITLLTLCLTLIGIGLVAWARIPIQMMPDGLSSPGLQIYVVNPGASAPENEEQVARVLEEELRTLIGIEDINSSVRQDVVSVSVGFQADTDMNLAKAEVRDRVERARPKLPSTVSEIGIWSWSQSDLPVMFFALMHPGDSPRTDFLVKEVITRRLEAVDGVGKVEVWGLLDDSRRIQLDEDKVRAAQLDLGKLIQRLSADNFALPMGEVEDGGRRILLRSDMRFASKEEIEAFPIDRGLKLGDIAHVEDVKSVRDSLFRIDGKLAYFGEIRKDGQANVVETCRRLERELAALSTAPEIAGEFEFVPIFNQGDFIENSLQQLSGSAVEGGILAIVILIVFLARLRLTLLVAASIPLSVLFTLAWVYFTGGTFNILTMSGITLALGMLVDNAIVVIENITRRKGLGDGAREAAIYGTREVALAVTLSTLTTIVVFLPLIFMGENPTLRIILAELGLPLCISLAFSLGVSLLFLPIAAQHSLGDRAALVQRTLDRLRPVAELPARALGLVGGVLRRLTNALGWLVHRLIRGLLTLAAPARWVLALLLLWVAALSLLPALQGLGDEAELRSVGVQLPGMSAAATLGWISLCLAMGLPLILISLRRWRARPAQFAPLPPPPADRRPSVLDGIERGNRALVAWSMRHRLLAGLLALACFASIMIPASNSQPAPFGQDESKTRLAFNVQLEDNFTLPQASGEMARYESFVEARRSDYGFSRVAARFNRTGGQIRLFFDKPQKQTHLDRITRELQRDLPRIAGHRLRFTDEEQGAGARMRSELSFAIQGPDSEELQRLVPAAIALLETVPGLSSVDAPRNNERDQVRLDFDSELAQKLNVSTRSALQNVSWALGGFQLPPFQERDRELPLILEYDDEKVPGLDTLRELQVFNGTSMVPLGSLAALQFGSGPQTIQRRNGMAQVTLRAKLENPAEATEVYRTGLQVLGSLDLPRGYSVANEDSVLFRAAEEFQSLLLAGLLGLVLTYIIMGILFESFLKPFVVLFTIPFAILGAYWSLYLANTPMDSMGRIGIIILVGVVVNNGIVLIDRIHQLREEGMERSRAVTDGTAQRVRPVLMTALTSVIGLIPMALSEPPGEGIDYRSLATCVAGGLTVSTFFTLWVIPLVYTWIDDLALLAAREFQRRRRAGHVGSGLPAAEG